MSVPSGWTRRLALVLAAVLASPAISAVQAESPTAGALFDSQEPLRLTVRAPLGDLVESIENDGAAEPRRDGRYRGTIAAGEGPDLPVTATVFGKSRLNFCTMPPLVLEPEPEAARGTVFEGQTPLRIVTHCGHQTGSDRWVLLEYLVYRAYQLIADPALEVRLAEIEYHDTSPRGRSRSAYAFLVEDIGRAARKRGLDWLTIRQLTTGQLDPDQATLLSLFQFMVGNTDWSMLRGPQGERCCHNLAVLGREGSEQRLLLPFDFDQAGLVEAPYSQPSKILNLQSVRQRRYRGFCVFNDRIPAAIELFNERRPAIEALFTDSSLPHPKPRERALRYLTSFYDVVNNPKRLQKLIYRNCRSKSLD